MTRGRLLLTGATGFIGGYLLEELVASGFEVIVAVRRESRRAFDPSTRVVTLDYSSASQMTKALQSLGAIDYVVHNAGVTKCRDAATFMEVNCDNTTRLLTALSKLPHPVRCFLYMSSMSSFSPNLTTEPLRADSPQVPVTMYGRSKLAAEQAVAHSGIPYLILCPTGVYGKGDRDYMISIDTMRHGYNFVSGTTPQLLSFVYVRDVARAVSFLLQHPESYGHRYLISDGEYYTDQDFTRIVSLLLGRRVHEVRTPLWIMKSACHLGQLVGRLRNRPSVLNLDKYPILSQRNWLCDISPLLKLGFRPQYDLRSGLEEALCHNGKPQQPREE